MMKANSVDPKKYLPFIANVDYNGVTKKNIHFTKTGELVDATITISEFGMDGKKSVLAVQ